MKKIVAALVLALSGLIGLASPADGATCTTTSYRTTTNVGWHATVKIRRVTVCRNDAGQMVSVRVTVRKFPIARTS